MTRATGCSVFLQFILDNAMIVLDKIHLLTDFRRSFRAEITLLKDELFDKVKETKPMLFLTAMCTKSVRSSFKSLIGVKCNSVHWPSPLEMKKRLCTHHYGTVLCRKLLPSIFLITRRS